MSIADEAIISVIGVAENFVLPLAELVAIFTVVRIVLERGKEVASFRYDGIPSSKTDTVQLH